MNRSISYLAQKLCHKYKKRKKNKESAKNVKNIIQMSVFLQNRKNPETEIFDRLNLSFVKDMYVDGKKLARNGHKTAIYELQI